MQTKIEFNQLEDAPLTGLQYARQSGTWKLVSGSNFGREVLTSARTYWVSVSGSDSNNGLTSGTPFLTIQRALNVVSSSIDAGGNQITIQVADGTYNESVVLPNVVNYANNTPTLLGNITTPSNVVISSSGIGLTNSKIGVWTVRGFKFIASTYHIYNETSKMYIGQCEFGKCSGTYSIVNRDNGFINLVGFITISQSVPIFSMNIAGATFNFSNATVNLTGTPAFSGAFVYCDMTAIAISVATYVGSGTGIRYTAIMNSVINTYGAGANHFPGDVAGSTATGGQYA